MVMSMFYSIFNKTRKLFKIIIILIIPLFNLTNLFSQQKDTELWTGTGIDIPVWDKLSIEPAEQFRFDNGITKLKSAITDLSLKYKINKYFKVSTTYRLYAIPDGIPNHALYLSGYFKYENKPLELAYRLTYKKKFEEKNQKQEHIRNKITAEFEASDWLKPFIAYELFYRLNYKKGDRFDNYRFYLGCNFKINKDHEIQLYYMREEEINMKKPKRTDIIGIFYNIDSWF
ncbi:MAG: DUF2490 domain-containing protein [Bacteroidetes bacterium]|nr:MAG: DUF2490 domain-containing protein [Bacteroidota bacterium]